MNNTSLGTTAVEMALAEEIRNFITPEHKVMAEEIREFKISTVWVSTNDKFNKRRKEYMEVYNYMELNLL